ncbi:MAG: hypothetical protein K8I00_09800, partial [Candidatus Omnitrophica bacterium]|nr:hypothetical protein [Candidatus Omnitrophota bacterium]
MIHELKPYLTSDIIASPYYFAHPTMSNLFNAYSTLLLGRLEDYRYFYDLAKQTERVLHLSPGQEMPVRLGEERGTLLCLDPQTFVFTTMWDNEMIDRPFSRQRLVEYMAIQDQNLFFENPQPYPARASNVFASLLVLYVLFQLITKLTDSRLLGIVGGFVYIFSPGIFIRSCLSEHVAYTNALLVILAYQFCFPREFAGKGRWGGYLKYVPGLMAGLINQKIIIMVLPLFFLQAYACFRDTEKGPFLRRLMKAAPIPVGFAAGTLMFWGYALCIDPDAFMLSHLRVHLFDRLLHVNTMFAGDYPGVGRLWYEFNYEFPPFLITVFALLYGLKDCRDRTMIFLVMWITSGVLFFSAVDWKQTNHLTQLTIPLLVIIMIYIEKQGVTYKRVLKVLVGFCLLYSFWFDMQLLENFHFYEPT